MSTAATEASRAPRRRALVRSFGALAAALTLLSQSAPAGAKLTPASGAWAELRVDYHFAGIYDVHASPDADIESPGFELALRYGLSRIDLGVTIAHVGTQWFPSELRGRLEPTGGAVNIAVEMRWRFAETGWGNVFIGPRVGVALFSLSESLMEEIAANGREPADLGVGFHTGLQVGLTFYVTPDVHLALATSVQIGVNGGPLGDGSPVDMQLLTAAVSAGIAFHM